MCFDRDELGLVYAEAMTASIEFLGNNGGDAGLMRAHVRIFCFFARGDDPARWQAAAYRANVGYIQSTD